MNDLLIIKNLASRMTTAIDDLLIAWRNIESAVKTVEDINSEIAQFEEDTTINESKRV